MAMQTTEIRDSTLETLHKIYGHTGEKMTDIMDRLVQLEWRRVSKEESYKAYIRQIGQQIIDENNAANSWISGEEFLKRTEELYGPEFIAAAKEGVDCMQSGTANVAG